MKLWTVMLYVYVMQCLCNSIFCEIYYHIYLQLVCCPPLLMLFKKNSQCHLSNMTVSMSYNILMEGWQILALLILEFWNVVKKVFEYRRHRIRLCKSQKNSFYKMKVEKIIFKSNFDQILQKNARFFVFFIIKSNTKTLCSI